MCHLPCQMQQFLRVANCSVTWILYPFGTEQFFFCKAFKCVFCLVEYIHHCIETIVLTLKAVFLCGGAYSKVPVHVKSHVPELDFFFVWIWSGEEDGQERKNVCVNVCFSPREGHRQAKLICIYNKGWKLEWEGSCQRKCTEEKYIK